MQIWERQPKETDPAFKAFCAYRDMPKRSLDTLSQNLSKSLPLLKGWSSKWKWQERCREYDNFIEGEAQKEVIKGTAKMIRTQIATAMKAQAIVIKRITGMSDEEIQSLKLNDITSLWKTAVDIERLSRGMATERAEVSTEDKASLSHLTYEQLLKLAGEEDVDE
jgi:hypothetical protein